MTFSPTADDDDRAAQEVPVTYNASENSIRFPIGEEYREEAFCIDNKVGI